MKGTEALYPDISQASGWLHQAAHILENQAQHDQATLKREYERLLSTMRRESKGSEKLALWVEHFCKVTTSYWSGLFSCYQVQDLPRTNNRLEQYFGSARHTERRVTGRKRASPALVIRGPVRVIAAGASRLLNLSPVELRLTDVQAWRTLRQQLEYRHEARRMQLRFRRDPHAYLQALEQRLITLSLPP